MHARIADPLYAQCFATTIDDASANLSHVIASRVCTEYSWILSTLSRRTTCPEPHIPAGFSRGKPTHTEQEVEECFVGRKEVGRSWGEGAGIRTYIPNRAYVQPTCSI